MTYHYEFDVIGARIDQPTTFTASIAATYSSLARADVDEVVPPLRLGAGALDAAAESRRRVFCRRTVTESIGN